MWRYKDAALPPAHDYLPASSAKKRALSAQRALGRAQRSFGKLLVFTPASEASAAALLAFLAFLAFFLLFSSSSIL
jgi:hypothetical protein